MWRSTERDLPELVRVVVDGTELKFFDVVYAGDLLRHTVIGETRDVESDGREIYHWATDVTILEGAGGVVDTSTIPREIPEWNARVVLNWDREGYRTLDIYDKGPLHLALVRGSAELHIELRGPRASSAILAAAATPVTVLFDLVLFPFIAIGAITYMLVTGEGHC
jgi:hypothetical protein